MRKRYAVFLVRRLSGAAFFKGKETRKMNLKKNLIKSIVLTTVTVIIGIASVLGADTRRTVRR